MADEPDALADVGTVTVDAEGVDVEPEEPAAPLPFARAVPCNEADFFAILFQCAASVRETLEQNEAAIYNYCSISPVCHASCLFGSMVRRCTNRLR